MKCEKSSRVAYEPANAVAKCQAKTNEVPQQTNHSQCNEALKHGGDHVLEAYHSAIKERKPGGHEQNKSGCHNHPSRVRFVNGVTDISRGLFGAKQYQKLQRADNCKNHDPTGPRLTHYSNISVQFPNFQVYF